MSVKLKPYPYREVGGASDIGAVRMIKMVAPYCPIEGQPMRGDKPNPRYTGEPNCQQAYRMDNQGRWDIKQCEDLGHEPFYFTQKSIAVENIVEADGTITGQRQKEIGAKRLNVVQVEMGVRHATGESYRHAVNQRGYRTLESFGYESPCEYRNCWGPQRVDTRFGKYCSERHARLIAADVKKIVLPILGGDPYTEEQMLEEREERLDNINIRKIG